MKAHTGNSAVERFKGEAFHRSRKPTKEDEMQADMTKAATDAAIKALKPIVQESPNKLLVNLARHEVEAMVVAAVTACDKRRRELEVLEELNDSVADIGA